MQCQINTVFSALTELLIEVKEMMKKKKPKIIATQMLKKKRNLKKMLALT